MAHEFGSLDASSVALSELSLSHPCQPNPALLPHLSTLTTHRQPHLITGPTTAFFVHPTTSSYFLTSTSASRVLLEPVKSALPNGYLINHLSRLFGFSARTRRLSKQLQPQSHLVARHVLLSRTAIPRRRWLRRSSTAPKWLWWPASARIPTYTAKLRCSVSRE